MAWQACCQPLFPRAFSYCFISPGILTQVRLSKEAPSLCRGRRRRRILDLRRRRGARLAHTVRSVHSCCSSRLRLGLVLLAVGWQTGYMRRGVGSESVGDGGYEGAMSSACGVLFLGADAGGEARLRREHRYVTGRGTITPACSTEHHHRQGTSGLLDHVPMNLSRFGRVILVWAPDLGGVNIWDALNGLGECCTWPSGSARPHGKRQRCLGSVTTFMNSNDFDALRRRLYFLYYVWFSSA